MSLNLKRRDAGEPTDGKPEEEKRPQKKYSVTTYVVLLFAVVIVIVLLSYFVQQRNNSEALLTLKEQHNQVTTEAFDSIEQLQKKNMELVEESEGKDERINELETRLGEAEDELNAAGGILRDARAESKAVKDLLDLQLAVDSGNPETAKEKIDALAVEKEALPAEYNEKYEALRAAYDELLAQ